MKSAAVEHSATAQTRGPDFSPGTGRLVRTPPVSIAPMMEKTDRHFRYFMRQITRHTLLYTEMITTGAIIHGDRDHLLAFDESEHPLALQLGGDNPEELAESIRIADAYGYDEYNLNVGCPSDRVQHARFGACLMAVPDHVRALVAAMRGATEKPVTVKHRIGIDGRESYGKLREFVEIVNAARPDRFTVHARIAILAGLSPKENRSVPPLRYDDVYLLKRDLPHLQIEVNGGIQSVREIRHHLHHVDGVMIGRAAYDNPWMMSTVDREFFPHPDGVGEEEALPTRGAVIEAMGEYLQRVQDAGVPPHNVLRHMLGLFAYQPGTRKYKQLLSGIRRDADGAELLRAATAGFDPEVLDA